MEELSEGGDNARSIMSENVLREEAITERAGHATLSSALVSYRIWLACRLLRVSALALLCYALNRKDPFWLLLHTYIVTAGSKKVVQKKLEQRRLQSFFILRS